MVKSIIGLTLWLTFMPTHGTESPSFVGRWRTQMHGALVDIKPCNDLSPCAVLVVVDQSISRGVTTDASNPDPSLRARPLIGLPILWGLSQNGRSWERGKVYNPETGQTFVSSMHTISSRELRVTGCWGFLCRSETWVRVDNAQN
jgi:uncharacterized protein (DUF2147 family)